MQKRLESLFLSLVALVLIFVALMLSGCGTVGKVRHDVCQYKPQIKFFLDVACDTTLFKYTPSERAQALDSLNHYLYGEND